MYDCWFVLEIRFCFFFVIFSFILNAVQLGEHTVNLVLYHIYDAKFHWLFNDCAASKIDRVIGIFVNFDTFFKTPCISVFCEFTFQQHIRKVCFCYVTKRRPSKYIRTFCLYVLLGILSRSATIIHCHHYRCPRNSSRWAAGPPLHLNIAWCRYRAAGERRWPDTSPGEIRQSADRTCTKSWKDPWLGFKGIKI